MQDAACARMLGCHFIEGAGHWVRQEQPQAVTELSLGALWRGRADLPTGV